MATAAEARWLHQTPEERLGRYIPGRGRDGHMQYVPRSAGDSARLSSEDIERLYYAATRRGGLRSVQEDADRAQYVGRDQDEVKMMYMSMRATRDAARRGEHGTRTSTSTTTVSVRLRGALPMGLATLGRNGIIGQRVQSERHG